MNGHRSSTRLVGRTQKWGLGLQGLLMTVAIRVVLRVPIRGYYKGSLGC